MSTHEYNLNNFPLPEIPLRHEVQNIEAKLNAGGHNALDEILRHVRNQKLDRFGDAIVTLLPENGDRHNDMRRRLGLQAGADVVMAAASQLAIFGNLPGFREVVYDLPIPTVLEKTTDSERWAAVGTFTVHSWRSCEYLLPTAELLSVDQLPAYADGVSQGIGLAYGSLQEAWLDWRAPGIESLGDTVLSWVDWDSLSPSDIIGQQ